MSKDWKIKNGTMVHGGPNRTQLIECSIRLDTTTNAYGFFGPGGKLEATVAPDPETGDPVAPPFNFPAFRSTLNGPVSREWYILVNDLDNPTPDLIDGKWSNHHYPRASGLNPDPDLPPPPGNSDTYTAQAGVGVEPEDEKKDKKKEKEAAAHASAKL